MTEAELQANIAELCKYLGAKLYHTHDSRRSNPGWPDCAIITRDHRFLLRELKSARGRLTTEQWAWLVELKECGIDVAVWRPSDWPDRIQRELSPVRATRGVE